MTHTFPRHRRPIAALAAAGAATLLLAACGAGGAGPDPEPSEAAPAERAAADLVIWTNTAVAPVLDTVAQQFAEANGITVAVQGVTNLPADFITADGSGFGPDVVVGPNDWIGNLVQNGSIDALSITDAQREAFVPVAVDAVRYGDQQYGLPYAFESSVLFRNTELADAAPETFEELVATGQELVDAGTADRVLSLQVGQEGDAYSMQPFYASAGGYLFGTNSDGSWNPDDIGVGEAGSIAFAEKLHQYGEQGAGVFTRSVTVDNAIPLFAEGTTPYLVSGPWALSAIRTAGLPYEIDPIPGFVDGGPATPFVGVQAFYVAKHGQNNAFAHEFVANFASGAEVQRALYDGDPRPPALRAVLDEVAAVDADTAKIAAVAADGMPMPTLPQMVGVWQPLGHAEAAVIGGADPVTTMKKAGEAIASKGE